uniref:Pre-mRNA-splicing factor SYF2 n=1 Tax=Equus asinus asinus TaxID=83772 RepID=A0A8C4L3K0_EQUAS
MAAATLSQRGPVGGAEEEQPVAAAEELAAQKREQRLRKFRELHLKRNEARKLNHQEVVEEDKRLKLPANWEAKKARLEWELQEEEKKKECAAKGEDYEKVKLLEISAEDAERWERKKKRKNPDLGFSGKIGFYFIEWASQISIAFSVSGFRKGHVPSWNILLRGLNPRKRQTCLPGRSKSGRPSVSWVIWFLVVKLIKACIICIFRIEAQIRVLCINC